MILFLYNCRFGGLVVINLLLLSVHQDVVHQSGYNYDVGI